MAHEIMKPKVVKVEGIDINLEMWERLRKLADLVEAQHKETKVKALTIDELGINILIYEKVLIEGEIVEDEFAELRGDNSERSTV